MFVLLSFFVLYFILLNNINTKIYVIISFVPVLFFSLAIDGVILNFWNNLFLYDRVYFDYKFIYFYLIVLFSFIIFCALLYDKSVNSDLYFSDAFVDLHLARILSMISFIGFVHNLYGAGNIVNIFIYPRVWELSFGRSTFFNYLYFLHVPALFVYGFISRVKLSSLDLLVVFFLFASLFFHGIKFTILHGFIYFTFGCFFAAGEVVNKKIVYIIVFLFVVLVLFFIYVRGGIDSFAYYFLSSSVNSLYFIQNNTVVGLSSLKSVNPFSFVPFCDIYNYFGYDFCVEQASGFELNDKYNLQHMVSKIGFMGGLFYFIYFCFFSIVVSSVRRFSDSVVGFFFCSFVVTTILFSFTGFEFSKTKIWFVFFALILLRFVLVFIYGCFKKKGIALC